MLLFMVKYSGRLMFLEELGMIYIFLWRLANQQQASGKVFNTYVPTLKSVSLSLSVQGPGGPVGDTGLPGPQGSQGPQGPSGRSIMGGPVRHTHTQLPASL